MLRNLPLFLLLVIILPFGCRQTAHTPPPKAQGPVWVSPDEQYGALFADVQMARRNHC